ncbi:MAG: acyl-CoA dehydrogenase family protein [Pseudomonadales bacterium]|jgi:alkylation response protein AidB-like acyl-CoA dehydrogenase
MENLIEFSEEQSLLLDTAMDFCSTHSPMGKVRSQIDEARGFDADQWNAMVELGWLSIIIPESHGGIGLGMADVVPIIECMGRQLMGSPFLATTLASHALIQGGTTDQKNEWLTKISGGAIVTVALQEESGDWNLQNLSAKATRTGDNITLSGKKTFVLDALEAELIIASVDLDGEAALLCLETNKIPGAQIIREDVIDETRRCFEISLDGITVPVTALFETNCLDSIEQAALLLLSAEMAGGIAGTLNIIIEYLNTRKQFDRLIGSYQALKHPTVDILLGLEACRSHVYHAATAFDHGSAKEREVALRMAKASASEHFAFAGDRAVQFHGGFGFTYECDAQLYLRRALWSQYQYGDEKYHRLKLAPLLLDEPS